MSMIYEDAFDIIETRTLYNTDLDPLLQEYDDELIYRVFSMHKHALENEEDV